MVFTASYIKLLHTGELEKRAKAARGLINPCRLCPHSCLVERASGQKGRCGSGSSPIVSSYTLHHGEEPCISGSRGAGNIFFGNCNLSCIYCQNHEISQNRKSEVRHETTVEHLAEIMLDLQASGSHNIGLVSPTHFASPILESIFLAAGQGLTIPIVYNSNGYDSVEVLRLFEDVIDIYLPDIKYGMDESGALYSKAPGYFTSARQAIKEMYRQTGADLVYNKNVLVRGLIIRHLVLPNDLADSDLIFKFIAEELSPEVHVSLMSQYYPAHKAVSEMLLSRPLSGSEYARAVKAFEKHGLINGWTQELDSRDNYRPGFEQDRRDPFGNKLNVL